jgi:hypothetical protein
MEKMKRLFRVLIVGVVAFVAWQIWQRVFVTDEKRIQKQIAVMESAVEKGNVLRLSDAVASDYNDDWGMDKSSLLAAVHSFRAQHEALFIHISDLTVTIEPDHQKAQAVFIAKILAQEKGSVTQSEIRADRFRLYFRKTDQGWKLART